MASLLRCLGCERPLFTIEQERGYCKVCVGEAVWHFSMTNVLGSWGWMTARRKRVIPVNVR